MQIAISERLKPFSHLPGTLCVLPGSFYQLQIFPARICILNNQQEIAVPVKGPITEFTVQLDLEKGCVNVWGRDQQAYFFYTLVAQEGKIALGVKKGLVGWTPAEFLTFDNAVNMPLTDRLSLGNHKSQDWEMVKRRGDLAEILPAWLKLGQLVNASNAIQEGTGALLKACQESSKHDIYTNLQNLFSAGFSGILNPRLVDEDYQGFDLPAVSQKFSPFFLLTEGAKLIRALFVAVSANSITLLPKLPVEFHCGRFLHVRCGELGLLDLEWTKKMVRRVIFCAEQDQSIHFHFPKEIVRFRLNGVVHSVDKPIQVQKNQLYYFDNFQK